jgi:hypothetical protein
MTTIRDEKEGNWDKFVIFAEEYGINLEHYDDYEMWWVCWNAAMDAVDEKFMGSMERDPVSDRPVVMDYFDWAERYKPSTDEPLDWEDAKDRAPRHVWTCVDTDDGPRIVTGFHLVNKIGYYITKKPHNFETFEVD